MSHTSVFCIATSEQQAAAIVDRLKRAGFSNKDISTLLKDHAGAREFAQSKDTKAPEGAATGAGAGAVVGGALGWLAGIGALSIPGIGPLVAAGPISAALSAAAVGGAVGGIAGALVGMGIPEGDARHYEAKVKRGGVFLSVHTEDAEETQLAEDIFREEDAEDIGSSPEPETMGTESRRLV